jgi:hypothetical protein
VRGEYTLAILPLPLGEDAGTPASQCSPNHDSRLGATFPHVALFPQPGEFIQKGADGVWVAAGDEFGILIAFKATAYPNIIQLIMAALDDE